MCLASALFHILCGECFLLLFLRLTYRSGHQFGISGGLIKKTQTRMTASVLKQDPSTQNVQKKAVYKDKIKHVNFRCNPPLSSYKTTVKQQLKGEKRWKMRWGAKSLVCFVSG